MSKDFVRVVNEGERFGIYAWSSLLVSTFEGGAATYEGMVPMRDTHLEFSKTREACSSMVKSRPVTGCAAETTRRRTSGASETHAALGPYITRSRARLLRRRRRSGAPACRIDPLPGARPGWEVRSRRWRAPSSDPGSRRG